VAVTFPQRNHEYPAANKLQVIVPSPLCCCVMCVFRLEGLRVGWDLSGELKGGRGRGGVEVVTCPGLSP
jgi:hypothetical protein